VKALIRHTFVKCLYPRTLANERGAVLIVALLVLVILAILGTVASNMSITEIMSSANERRFNQTFYVAESGWQVVAPILNNIIDDAPVKNSTTNIVDLSALEPDIKTMNGIDYDFVVTELGNRPAPGSGEDYAEFQYQVVATADGRQQVRVVLNKVFKKGY
jgi:PilX N-terminal